MLTFCLVFNPFDHCLTDSVTDTNKTTLHDAATATQRQSKDTRVSDYANKTHEPTQNGTRQPEPGSSHGLLNELLSLTHIQILKTENLN